MATQIKKNKRRYAKLKACDKRKVQALGRIYKKSGDHGVLDQAIYIVHKNKC